MAFPEVFEIPKNSEYYQKWNVHHTFLVQVYPVIYICNIIELDFKNVNFILFTHLKSLTPCKFCHSQFQVQ